jgi:hypothetical protein
MTDIIAKHNGKYKSQRDNAKIYYLHGSNYVDQDGEVLFPAKDLDENESKLFDRTTECFISTGSMFCDSLYNAGIIKTSVDELAYKVAVINTAKGPETRFYWSAHERFLDQIIKNKSYDFYFHKAKGNEAQIMESIDNGFPVMCSIWIKSWYPSGRGHLVLIVGYREDMEGKLSGFIVNDPFGDCLSQYKNHDGHKVFYPLDEFKKMMNSPDDQPRFMGVIRSK